MAINRIWQSGLEAGTTEEFDSCSAVLAGTPNTGTWTIRNSLYYGGGAGSKTIPATRQVRAGMYLDVVPTNLQGGRKTFFSLDHAGGELVSVNYHGTDNAMSLYVEGVLKDQVSNLLTRSIYQHIGVDVKIDSSAGWVKVYNNGILALSFEGDTGDDDIVDSQWGISYYADWAAYCHMDDMYIDDSTGEGSAAALGMKKFFYLKPDGAGNYTEWTPSAGSNYECVDEAPPSDADYVSVAAVDQFDSYTLDTFTLEPNELIHALIPTTRADRDAATEQLALGTRLSSTDLVGADQDPSGTFDYYFERQTAKPGGGSWGQSDMDGAEVILKSRGTY